MYAFNLEAEQVWDPNRHVEKILKTISGGDVTVACWEPGQCSPHHCHPEATEIYFCYTGGGTMRTPDSVTEVVPGSFADRTRCPPDSHASGTRADRSSS